jgi:hypothetical protein
MDLILVLGLPIALLAATIAYAISVLVRPRRLSTVGAPHEDAATSGLGADQRQPRPLLQRVPLVLVTAVGAFLVVPVVLVGVFVASVLLAPEIRWEFPDGFRGWVVVRHEDPSCPAMVQDGPTRVITLDQPGCGCTSDPLPERWRPSYAYVHPDGARTEILSTGWGGGGAVWGGATAPRQDSMPFPEHTFFVGTEEEFKSGRFPPPGPRRWSPCSPTG